MRGNLKIINIYGTMYKEACTLIVLLIFCGCSNSPEPKQLSEEDTKLIKKEVLTVAEKWINAWSGKIETEKMMTNYHPDMKYVWRGVSPPGNYEGFKNFVEEILVPNANYELTMSNVDISVVDKNHAIIFFHFNDKNEDPYGSGAASLVMKKVNMAWKIIYVHESSIDRTE